MEHWWAKIVRRITQGYFPCAGEDISRGKLNDKDHSEAI